MSPSDTSDGVSANICGRSASVAAAHDDDVLVAPPVAAAGSYAPLVHANDAISVPVSDVVPSALTEIEFDIPENAVNADPLVPCCPAPAARITAPAVVGVIAGGFGRDAFVPVAVVVVTSSGVEVLTPLHACIATTQLYPDWLPQVTVIVESEVLNPPGCTLYATTKLVSQVSFAYRAVCALVYVPVTSPLTVGADDVVPPAPTTTTRMYGSETGRPVPPENPLFALTLMGDEPDADFPPA